jgi:hypothetical protein
VPLNYARHALRGLSVWLFTLPFCLVKDLGILTGLVTAIMAWLLFGIYQIGYHVEDPFQGSLRLSILCDAIRRDLMTADQSAFESLEGHHLDPDQRFSSSGSNLPLMTERSPSPLELVLPTSEFQPHHQTVSMTGTLQELRP